MTWNPGLHALIHFVAERWCLGGRLGADWEKDFRSLLPKSGPVTADQFVDCVFRASEDEVGNGAPRWERARTEIRAAFVEHMGGESVDAAALAWPEQYLPLPDPEAFTRNLTEEELRGYEKEFGAGSREWMLAQNELRRRRWPSPLVVQILWATASLLVIAYFLWRWLRP